MLLPWPLLLSWVVWTEVLTGVLYRFFPVRICALLVTNVSLAADLTNFYAQYKSIEPWLKRKDTKAATDAEYLQTPADRQKLDGMYEVMPR